MPNARTWLRVLLGVVLLGLILRGYHYLRDPAMWHDEAAAVINVLHKSWGELLGPLYWAEAAPPLFLWGLRAVALCLGDSTLALRLVPFLASCLMLPLFAWVAWRNLPPVSAVVATLLIATSDRLLWHACEAKSYAIDAFLAVGLLALHQAGRAWRLEWLLTVQILLAPLLLWVSYPAAFLVGASLVVLLPQVVTQGRWSAWVLYGFWALVVFGAFVALVLGPARAQRCGPMDACWVGHFPPYSNPLRIPVWGVASVMEVVRYCFKPLGTGLTLLAVVGGVVWGRTDRWRLVVLGALPLGLALLASFLKQYPFGASRLEVFAAPGLALLIGAGLLPVWNFLADRHRLAPVLVAVLLFAGVGLTLYRVAVPWYREDATSAAEYVRSRAESDDVIVGNMWEHLYYFRGNSHQFRLLVNRDEFQPECELGYPDEATFKKRCWILCANATSSSGPPVPPGWSHHHLVDHRTYEGVDVYLIAR